MMGSKASKKIPVSKFKLDIKPFKKKSGKNGLKSFFGDDEFNVIDD